MDILLFAVRLIMSALVIAFVVSAGYVFLHQLKIVRFLMNNSHRWCSFKEIRAVARIRTSWIRHVLSDLHTSGILSRQISLKATEPNIHEEEVRISNVNLFEYKLKINGPVTLSGALRLMLARELPQ